MEKFDFYGLYFKDRHTYQHYKEFKNVIECGSSTHTKGFRVGIDDHCLDRLEQQFRREGYRINNTKNYPIIQYDKDTEQEQKFIYLTVGTSITISEQRNKKVRIR